MIAKDKKKTSKTLSVKTMLFVSIKNNAVRHQTSQLLEILDVQLQ